MKKTKSCTAMSVLFRVAIFQLMGLSLLLCFGCGEEPEEDMSIGEVTVYNIPASILVNNGTASNPTFKVYLYASDSMDEKDLPVAKGMVKISADTLNNGKHSVTIKLQKPNSAGNDNPNENTGPWSGTAKVFSIMISPQSVAADGVDAVWIKGGMTLNKGKKECNWESQSLTDFRTSPLMDFRPKAQALYDDIICKDDDIAKN